jgi:hypothetical protein
VSWCSRARGLPAWGGCHPWLQLWPTGASCIHIRLASKKNRAWKLVWLLLISLLSLLIFTYLFSLVGFALGRQNVSALPMGLAQVQEVENIAVFMPAWTDVEALVRWVALLEGELVKAHRAREVAEEKVHDLSSSLAEGSR